MSESVGLFAAIFATLCLMAAPEAPAQTDAAIDVAAPTTPSRAAESGRFFIQNFSPRDYGQHNANWAVAQDSSGLIYAANTNGVMIFDGASWQLVRTETRSTVRSLAVDARNRVYVGAHGDLGYLASDSLGEVRFVSLLDRLAAEERDFTNVWQTFALPDGIYFMAPQRLMRWSESRGFQVWEASTSFHVSFVVRDTLYVRQRDAGLLRMTDDGLHLLPGSDILRDEEVFELLPYRSAGLLAFTRTMGTLRYDGEAFRPFATAAGEFLAENQVYDGTVLPDGSFAIGTLRGGVAIIDSTGAFLHRLDESSGLRDQKTWFTFVDRDGGLWLGLDDGLARVEISSPITFFNEETGLEGWIGDIVRYEGRLYVATGLGVYRLVPADGNGTRSAFERISAIDASCWSLLATDAGLIATCQDRTYVYRDGETRTLHAEGTGHSLVRSKTNPQWVFEGMNDGLVKLRLQGNRWRFAGRTAGVSEQIYTLAEDRGGALWLGTGHEGALRLDFGGQITVSPRIERFDTRHGLPEGWVNAFDVNGGIRIGTQTGLFYFDDVARRFVRDTLLSAGLSDAESEVFLLHEEGNGDVWMYSDPDVILMRRAGDGSYRLDATALSRIPDAQAYRFFSEDDGVMWVGRADGLYRFDRRFDGARDDGYPALIRRITALDTDSLIFGGDGVRYEPARLPFISNSVRFSFGAPRFDDVDAIRYQTRLEGFDGGWSDWTAATDRDYTNLPPGDYVFRVRARDAFGDLSREAAFRMSILPPWYRSWWAYLIYGALGLALVTGVARWRSRRLVEQKRRLEDLVDERTEEIEQQRRQLESQAEELLEHDKLKSRFFANVSHEFRTPLTLTIGPLEDLKDGLYGRLDGQVEEQVNVALRNSRRLLRLINQILDAAKIESGRLALRLDDGDLAEYLRATAEVFAPLAERRGVALRIDIPKEPVPSKFDAEQLEKVFGNLLSNAFKFTPKNGRLRVSLRPVLEDGSHWARIEVEDSGPGIPADQIPHIFERFYQADNARQPAGTGIGLSLAKELVELHGGRINVESREDVGTVFSVLLPISPAEREGRVSGDDGRPDCDAGFAGDGAFPDGDGAIPDGDGAVSREAPAARPGLGVEPADAGGAATSGTITADGDGASAPSEAVANARSEEDTEADDVTTLLIADDNAEVRAYLRRHFEPDYRVVEAADGREALTAIRKHLPDVVICDVTMPGLDGYAVCEKMKSDPELDFIPIILLTGRASRDDKIEGWNEGADAYVTKPFDMGELQALVANLITSRQRLRDRLLKERAVRVSPQNVVSSDEAYLNRVRASVEENLANSDFNVEALASDVGQSRVQLYRRLQALVGKSPSELTREIRLERAAALLSGRAGTVSEIAYGVGFKSVSHFCKCFRDQYGASPTEYVDG